MKGKFRITPIKCGSYYYYKVKYYGIGKFDRKTADLLDDFDCLNDKSFVKGLEWDLKMSNKGLKLLDSDRSYNSFRDFYFAAREAGINSIYSGLSRLEISDDGSKVYKPCRK